MPERLLKIFPMISVLGQLLNIESTYCLNDKILGVNLTFSDGSFLQANLSISMILNACAATVHR